MSLRCSCIQDHCIKGNSTAPHSLWSIPDPTWLLVLMSQTLLITVCFCIQLKAELKSINVTFGPIISVNVTSPVPLPLKRVKPFTEGCYEVIDYDPVHTFVQDSGQSNRASWGREWYQRVSNSARAGTISYEPNLHDLISLPFKPSVPVALLCWFWLNWLLLLVLTVWSDQWSHFPSLPIITWSPFQASPALPEQRWLYLFLIFSPWNWSSFISLLLMSKSPLTKAAHLSLIHCHIFGGTSVLLWRYTLTVSTFPVRITAAVEKHLPVSYNTELCAVVQLQFSELNILL